MNETSIEQQLAWYVNGTLDAQQRADVERWLAANPQARAQLAELEFLQDTVAEVSAQEPQLAADGFERLLAQIDAEAALEGQVAEYESVTESATAAQPGVWARIQQWCAAQLQWQQTPAFARVAVVAQFALVAVLGGVILLPQNEAGYTVLSGEAGHAVVDGGVTVDIGINPQASLAQLQALLRAWEGRLVAGPNSLGVFRLVLPAQTDLEALSSHEIVTYLQPVQP